MQSKEYCNLKKRYGKKFIFCTAFVLLLSVSAVMMGFLKPKVAATPAHICAQEARKAGYYTFLVCGVDNAAHNTDVMMLVSVDGAQKCVNILQIPRDTFVNPEKAGFRVTRVNGICAAAYNASAEKGREKAAMETLCESIEAALCVVIDRYVLMDTAAFVKIIDAVGGVEYDIPRDMHYEDPVQGLSINLKAGKQRLSGAEAEQFVRYRAGYATGDVGRVEAREGFLAALFAQMREKLSPAKALKIAGELMHDVTTDMSLSDMAYFAKALYGVENENFHIKTLAGSAVQNPKTGAWTYYALNKRLALDDINKYMNARKEEITHEDFDKNALFTDDPEGENPYISEYYYSEE